MQDDLAFAVIAFTSLLVVYNPLSAMPMFVSLTADDSPRRRFATASLGVLTSPSFRWDCRRSPDRGRS